MNKLKLALTVLSIAVIVWGIVFYIDFHQYIKLLEKHGIHYDTAQTLLTYLLGLNSGRAVFFTGAGLFMAWVIFIETTTLGETLSEFMAAIKKAFQNEKRS